MRRRFSLFRFSRFRACRLPALIPPSRVKASTVAYLSQHDTYYATCSAALNSGNRGPAFSLRRVLVLKHHGEIFWPQTMNRLERTMSRINSASNWTLLHILGGFDKEEACIS